MKRVRFPCVICKKKVNSSEIRRDHIIPVIPETGFPKLKTGEDDWNVVINRMFEIPNNIQMICKICHDEKTKGENKLRKSLKKKKK